MNDEITLQQIIELLSSHIYWKDVNGVILGCNQGQARDLGYPSPQEVVGKTDYDLFSKDRADAIRALDIEVMNSGASRVEEEIALTDNGTEAFYLSKKEPLRDSIGRIIGILGVSIDITDRKHNEKIRKELESEAAKKVVDFTNKLACSMAHELRTPLAIISMQVDLINLALTSGKTQGEKEEVYKHRLKAIKDTVKSTAYVINDMLTKIRDFAKGKVEGVAKLAVITEDLEEFLSLYPFRDNEKDLITLKNFDALDNRFSYLGDPILIKHVFSNLMRNALRAIKEAEKGEIFIELKAGKGEDQFNYLIFKDTALGISQDLIDKIFKYFENKENSGGGLGLGLYFCKMVMKTLGGDIICNSQPGEHTEFVLSFPKVAVPE